MTDLCTVCGLPRPCPAERSFEVAWMQAHPEEYPNLFTPTPSEKEQQDGE
jgi:hypothetical protein